MTFTLDHIVNTLQASLLPDTRRIRFMTVPIPREQNHPAFLFFSCLYHRGAGGGAVPA